MSVAASTRVCCCLAALASFSACLRFAASIARRLSHHTSAMKQIMLMSAMPRVMTLGHGLGMPNGHCSKKMHFGGRDGGKCGVGDGGDKGSGGLAGGGAGASIRTMAIVGAPSDTTGIPMAAESDAHVRLLRVEAITPTVATVPPEAGAPPAMMAVTATLAAASESRMEEAGMPSSAASDCL